MHIFYEQHIQGDTITLGQEESRHCLRVLRMRPGQEAIIVDGKGNRCRAVLQDAGSREAVFSVTEKESHAGRRPFHLHMAVAPTKNIDRFEWFLEKATECGIDEITPVICEKSERRVIKPQRLEKILVAAMKQSLRAVLPRLNAPTPLEEFLRQPFAAPRFIAHCGEGSKQHIANAYTPGSDALFLVGPEGDFSESETEAAAAQGFTAISMGSHRLRTETAALALCVQVNSMNALL